MQDSVVLISSNHEGHEVTQRIESLKDCPSALCV
jgi:hypothetical protein